MSPLNIRSRRIWILAALSVGACSDFSTAPDQIPESLVIEPADTLITQGDQVLFRVTVLDEDGEPFPPLPSWAPPRWSFSDPDAVAVAPDGSLEGVGGGEVYLTAKVAGLNASTKLRVNPNSVALSAPRVYLVQSVQNLRGTVPLLAGIQALLRVFVTSEPASFYQPRARATFYLDGAEVHSVIMDPRSELIRDQVDEGPMNRSFNAIVPDSIVQLGLEVVIELDLDGVVPLAPESEVRIPAEGRMALDVLAMPPFEVTVVPVLLAAAPDDRVFDWTEGLTPNSSTLRFLRAVLPVGEVDLEVHESYTSTADLTTGAGWSAFLSEMAVVRLAEGSDRYYYGAVVLPHGSAWGGLGYIARPTSVGRPTDATFAHELGHNLSLRHAPCGNVSSYDSNYPYAGGSAGTWGWEAPNGFGMGFLRDPDHYKDLMGYCTPKWISDYHFMKALAYRQAEIAPSEPAAPREQVLLLWGSANDGELLLEPTFVLDAPPLLPSEAGPYRLEGVDADGDVLFSLDFAASEVEWGGAHFAFAVPMETEGIEALATITLTGPEGAVAVDRSTRLPRMALATDETTGRVRAILRDGRAPATLGPNARVSFSQGLPENASTRRRE